MVAKLTQPICLAPLSQGQLVDVNPLIAFRTFQFSSHTGAVIASWKEKMLSEWNLHAVRCQSTPKSSAATPAR